MDNDRSIKKWKTLGRALAWSRLILTIFALLYDITSNRLNNRIIVIVFAIATCTLWLYGISENRTVAMLISLLIWGVQTIIELGCLSILFLIYTALISENHHKDGFDILESMLVYAILLLAIVVCVGFFTLALISYIKIDESIQRSGFNVIYVPPPPPSYMEKV